ncbi:hypothetical protein B0T22DRAFT_363950, partial [Podospora appendiculata]
DTAEALMHPWYSAFIPSQLLSAMRGVIKPSIANVCTKVAGKGPTTHLGKTWVSGRCLHLTLLRDQWLALGSMLDTAPGLTYVKATKSRHSVSLAPKRVEARE